MSLPFVAITNISQESAAIATILWTNQFCIYESRHHAISIPIINEVPWSKLRKALEMFSPEMNGFSLTDLNLKYLCKYFTSMNIRHMNNVSVSHIFLY